MSHHNIVNGNVFVFTLSHINIKVTLAKWTLNIKDIPSTEMNSIVVKLNYKKCSFLCKSAFQCFEFVKG